MGDVEPSLLGTGGLGWALVDFNTRENMLSRSGSVDELLLMVNRCRVICSQGLSRAMME